MKLFTREELKRKDIDTLKRHLRWKIGGYTVASIPMTTDNVLFRAVKCAQQPTTVCRISYPKPHHVTENGRLNRAGSPLFYCSRGAPSAFFEIRAKQGDTIALSRWSLTQPLWMRNLGYCNVSEHRSSLACVWSIRYPMRHVPMSGCVGRCLWPVPKTCVPAKSIDTSCRSLSTNGCSTVRVRCRMISRTARGTGARPGRSTPQCECAGVPRHHWTDGGI
jgi:hypothetical protein